MNNFLKKFLIEISLKNEKLEMPKIAEKVLDTNFLINRLKHVYSK